MWRGSPNREQTEPTLRVHVMGQVWKNRGERHTRLDSRGPTQGAGVPLVASLEPNFLQVARANNRKSVHWCTKHGCRSEVSLGV
jgi:hypothetical protein